MSWFFPWSKSHENDVSAADEEEENNGSLDIPKDALGTHILYEPSDPIPDVDIIAVHGLGGDAFSTWTHKASGCLWLHDLLPKSKSYKNSRIMTFGYDARAFIQPFQDSTTGRTFTFAEALLFDLSNLRCSPEAKNRPLIFLGHSLGGIVIKSALVSANNQQLHYGDILNSTRCLVFFGTPHEGVDAAIWAGYLGKLVRGLGIESTGVMQELKRWSNPLVELKTSFAQLAPRFLIRTFFETHSLHNVLIVPEGSARMSNGNKQAVGLEADCLQICKFEDAKNANAKRVLQTFEAVMMLLKAQPYTEQQLKELPSLNMEQESLEGDAELKQRLSTPRK